MPRIWLQWLTAVWVVLIAALAEFSGPVHPLSACARTATLATVEWCNHDRDHPGTPSTCSDHCRAGPMAAMEQPAPPALPSPQQFRVLP